MVVVGCKYKHFKGNVYKVLALANHTETNELLVVYQDLNKLSREALIKDIVLLFDIVLDNEVPEEYYVDFEIPKEK